MGCYRRTHWLIVAILVIAAPTVVSAQVVRSAKSGAWSAPATWDTAKVPTAGSRVLIRSGHIVRYDVVSPEVIRVIHVAGTLTFAHDRDTRLDVGLIRIQTGTAPSEEGFDCEGHLDIDDSVPRPALEVGAPNQPIGSKFTALIRLHFIAGMDRQSCPAIVCCGGRMDIHGSPMPRTWLPLGATTKKGNAAVFLQNDAIGWKTGDRVILTATHGQIDAEYGTRRPGKRNVPVETEEHTIKAIDGAKLTLDQPLQFTHQVDGDFRGGVGNLSRNVVIESANPRGVRGHTMYHRNSQGAISYAEFRHLGKENVLGRYAIHYHLVGNTMRGSYVQGASIWDSHNRWITVHGTNMLVVRDCVGYQSIGHGFYLEDGTEILNVFDRNLAVHAYRGQKLPKQAIPFDENKGAGFWWANSLNMFTNNLTCENDRYGYRFEAIDTPAMKVTQPVLFPDGKRRLLDLRMLPFVRFDGNESHCDGRYGFNLGEGVEGVGPNASFPFVIRNMKIWGAYYAFRPQSPSVLAENLTIKTCAYGVYHPNYDRHVYRNLHIIDTQDEPFNRGHDDDSVQYGSVTVDGLTLDGIAEGGAIAMIQISDDNPTGRAATHIRGLKIVNPRDKGKRAIVDLGGSARPDPKTNICVPIYLHDYFGAGRHAKIVSVKSAHLRLDGLKYGTLSPLTGDDARVAEVRDVPFPRLLDLVDDFPPCTIITHLIPSGDSLIVRGTASDNGTIVKVVVNGVSARAMRPNFAEWEATLKLNGDELTVRAHAHDAAGNVEPTPHEVPYRRR